MLKNYLSTALTHLTTQKLYSTINLAGLAVGLACFIVIAQFVRHELGYDRQWTDADRIYRVSRDYFARADARERRPASANAPIAPALLQDFPEIEHAARVFGGRSEQAGRTFGQRSLLGREDAAFYEDRLRFADNELFAVFDFDWLRGDPRDALAEPRSIVLNRTLARKYFGEEDPLGGVLVLNNQVPLNVTGVIDDLPDNTHLSIDALVSLSTFAASMPAMLQQWNGNTDFHTYVRLRAGADVGEISSRMPQFLDRHVENGSSFSGLTLMKVADIHLRSNRDEEWKPVGSLGTVLSFAAIALGILTIACINFMNLSTARAAKRAREVAVRKSLGAGKRQIVVQFLAESLLYAAIATVLAVALVELTLPALRAFAGVEITFDYFEEPTLLLGMVALIAAVGIAAGSYPAFYLSAFTPYKVLKGEVTRGPAGVTLRNALVVTQFAVAIALLIGTAVVHQQTQFARNLDLGFNKDQVVVVTGAAALDAQWPAFKNELRRHAGVLNVTASHYTPLAFDDNQLALRRPGSSSLSRVQHMRVDHDFFETYELEILAGRSFSAEADGGVVLPTEDDPRFRVRVVLNESAARLLGWSPEEASAERVEIGFNEQFEPLIDGTVVGVVADAHFESVNVAVRPLLFLLVPPPTQGIPLDFASVRVARSGLTATLDHIDTVWRRFRPDTPIARHFLDQDFEALYRAERRQGRMFALFSVLAVFIACLGLVGLASYTTEQRTKEIGLRKVMGATVLDIVRLFTGEFGKLVLIANVVAWPAAYLLMQRWLENFAYRIDMNVLVFAASALVALGVAAVTVGIISARAAAVNPIESLRYE